MSTEVKLPVINNLRGVDNGDGSFTLVTNSSNSPSKFRDTFGTLDATKWTTRQTGSGDILQIDGNAAGSSYLVFSKDPLTAGTETILDTVTTFVSPVRIGFGASISQRILGQEFSVEMISTDESSLTTLPALTISTTTQTTTTLSVTTTTAHGLLPGMRVSISGVPDSRLNYPCLTIATTPSATSFTATAQPGATIPSVTSGPFVVGTVTPVDPVSYSRNAVSFLFDSTSATNASYFVRADGGTVVPSGTINGSQTVSVGTTTATQAVNTTAAYAFVPATQYEIITQLEQVSWQSMAVDSASATPAMFKRTQAQPGSGHTYKLRVRAKNHVAMPIPVAQVVSAAKTGTTTTTITTDVAHGLTTSDFVTVVGIRDQTNFAALTTPTVVASVVNSTTFTVVLGISATATSFGGVVHRANGSAVGGLISQSLQSIARASNVVTVIGSATWTGLSIGEYVNLVGVRDNSTGATLSLDGPYRVRDLATTTLVLEPIGTAPTGVDVGSVNCGGAVVKRTDFRMHFARVMEFSRQIIESYGGLARPDQNAAEPVQVTNGSMPIPGHLRRLQHDHPQPGADLGQDADRQPDVGHRHQGAVLARHD
jgi:hypothetical protein